MVKRAFICIIGIDGSGKTTQALKLLAQFRQSGIRTAYAHCYHRPILLKPLKILAKLTIMRGTNEFSNYMQYRKKKTSASKRHGFFTKTYALVWITDYWIQAFIQVSVAGLLSKVLIIDRYIYDTALNVSLSLNESIDYACRLVDFFLKFNPKPTHFFLIDLPAEIAFSRKDDIQSVYYLKERRERYLRIAERYGAIILDGTLKPELLQNQIRMAVGESEASTC